MIKIGPRYFLSLPWVLNLCVHGQLTLPPERTSGLGCIPVGTTVSYQCTVMDQQGIASTLWQGSAFDCPENSNQITLPHSLFSNPAGVMGACGVLSAVSTSVVNNDYTSKLSFTTTAEMNGQTINCTISGVVLVGSDTIKTGEIPAAPGPVVVNIDSSSSLSVSWTPPADVSNIAQYLFSVTGSDCGSCSDMITPDTSVLCSGLTARDQSCTFTVRSISTDCGFTSASSENTVVLSVPSPPGNVVFANLRDSCSFQSSTTTLTWTDQSPPGVPVTMFQVTVSYGSMDVFTTTVSGTESSLVIPGSSFSFGACTYLFTVSAVNMLGERSSTLTVPEVSLTNIVSTFDIVMTTVRLSYTISNVDCVGSELVVYYELCSSLEACVCSSNFTGSTITVTVISHLTIVNITVQDYGIYCYHAEVIDSQTGLIVGFESSHIFQINSAALPAFATALIIIFCLLLIALVVVVAAVLGVCFAKKRKGVVESPAPAVYEDPDAVRAAGGYENIETLPELKGSVYEDIQPDPSTQTNVAYGHVQF